MAIAQKECEESIYWFELLEGTIDEKYIEIEKLKKEAHEILLILSAIILKTKENSKLRM